MKYVMFRDKLGRKIPVVFPEILTHSVVAKAVIEGAKTDGLVLEPVSAGNCTFEDDGMVNCFGKSVSLNLESHFNDSHILTNWDLLRGF